MRWLIHLLLVLAVPISCTGPTESSPKQAAATQKKVDNPSRTAQAGPRESTACNDTRSCFVRSFAEGRDAHGVFKDALIGNDSLRIGVHIFEDRRIFVEVEDRNSPPILQPDCFDAPNGVRVCKTDSEELADISFTHETSRHWCEGLYVNRSGLLEFQGCSPPLRQAIRRGI